MMKYLILSTIGIFTILSATAQENMNMSGNKTTTGHKEMVSTTTEKSYKLVMGDQVIRNAVRIKTERFQDILLDQEDAGMVNQDRVLPKKKIVKVVKIDNDADDHFDEMIRFSYVAHAANDFILVSNEDELFVALDDGENLTILENNKIRVTDLENGREAFIITDNNGEEIEFYIDEYKSLAPSEKM